MNHHHRFFVVVVLSSRLRAFCGCRSFIRLWRMKVYMMAQTIYGLSANTIIGNSWLQRHPVHHCRQEEC